jgi:hypothetical protein
MRSLAFLHLMLAVLSSRFALADNRALERVAQKACLAGEPRKGVEILAGLYVETKDITYIFNQGRCFEQNRMYEDAIGRFREYLVKGEERLSADEKAVAQKRIASCESYLSKNERSVMVPETVHPWPVVESESARAKTEPAGTTVARRPPDGQAGSGLRIAGIAVGSVGIAAVVSGVILNLKVNSMSSDLEKTSNFNRDTDNTRQSYKTMGWVAYGLGAACLAGGPLLYYLGWRAGNRATATASLVPVLGPDGAGLALAGAL